MATSSLLLNPSQDRDETEPPGRVTPLAANDPPVQRDRLRACPAEISPGVDELVEREFADVYLLNDHLSGRADRKVGIVELEGCPEPGQKANLIDQVCEVRWPANGDQPKAAKQAAILFKARDKLSELVAPATGLTVAYTLLVAPGRSVIRVLADALTSPALLIERFGAAIPSDQTRKMLDRAIRLAAVLKRSPAERAKVVRDRIEKVVIEENAITIRMRRSSLSGGAVVPPSSENPERQPNRAYSACGLPAPRY
jgi:hypothetical protein